MRLPTSTYRLQITSEFTLTDAADVVPYLARLGVDWVYLSPLLAAEPGSIHGYDVVDHDRADPARGGAQGLSELAEAAHAAGLGVLVDIVPNHVGVATAALSRWWWELLRGGPDSPRASAFDVDWAAGGGRIRLPVLGDGPDALDELRVQGDELHYFDHRFPIAPGTAGGSAREVHDRQHYELMSWRRADAELNYRRFFGITTLAGIRVEDPDVFAAAHAEIARWVAQGWVDGLRIDHPDGLADPSGYLRQLKDLIGEKYVVVEKILEPGEKLPPDWACAGTTGYDALAELDRLFVDPAGQQALDELDTELRGGARVDWPAMTIALKQQVADHLLRAEVLRLARLLPGVDRAQDALAALLAAFPVYRSYLPVGREHLDRALAAALVHRPELAGPLSEVAQRLTEVGTQVCTRFQQTSGMVMAKGVEDCAFYRWTRLTSLTEVGADPSQFSLSPTEFHTAQQARLADWPYAMTTLTTHDTKRGEDTRARISVLSEVAGEWSEAMRSWLRRLPDLLATPADPLGIDPPLAHLIFQAAVGAWPVGVDRLTEYARKAAREAGVRTCWTDPDERFEKALDEWVDAVLDPDRLGPEVAAWAARVTPAGWSNSLSAKLLQLVGPGVPDVYQGSEHGQFSLVDPDNRRPVDFAGLVDALSRSDHDRETDHPSDFKQWVCTQALQARREEPDAFSVYRPLTAVGPAVEHAVAVDRGGAVVVATRLPLGLRSTGWGDTTLALPEGEWTDRLRGTGPWAGEISLGDLLGSGPVALLMREV